MCSILLSTYTILTKREVKMVGYWPNSFFVLFFLFFFKTKLMYIKIHQELACSNKLVQSSIWLYLIMNQEGLVYFKTLQRKPTVFVAPTINPQESLIYVF